MNLLPINNSDLEIYTKSPEDYSNLSLPNYELYSKQRFPKKDITIKGTSLTNLSKCRLLVALPDHRTPAVALEPQAFLVTYVRLFTLIISCIVLLLNGSK